MIRFEIEFRRICDLVYGQLLKHQGSVRAGSDWQDCWQWMWYSISLSKIEERSVLLKSTLLLGCSHPLMDALMDVLTKNLT